MNIDDSMINTSIANAQQQSNQPSRTLRESVTQAMQTCFHHLDNQNVVDVYQMVMNEVEAPLLEEVMRYTRNNQTKASQMLGLNRGTLRKKLKQYDLL